MAGGIGGAVYWDAAGNVVNVYVSIYCENKKMSLNGQKNAWKHAFFYGNYTMNVL